MKARILGLVMMVGVFAFFNSTAWAGNNFFTDLGNQVVQNLTKQAEDATKRTANGVVNNTVATGNKAVNPQTIPGQVVTTTTKTTGAQVNNLLNQMIKFQK